MMHVSMASGGTYVALLAGFWDEMDQSSSGRRLQASIDSYSGSSAGAIVGALKALNVPSDAIVDEVQHGGLRGGLVYLRALGVYLGLFKSMYDGDHYLRRLQLLHNRHKNARLRMRPVTVAVTDHNVRQRCLTYKNAEGVLNAAVASASVPFVLPARYVSPIGMCVDGSVNQASFADNHVLHELRTRSGHMMLLNTMPWPGFREVVTQRKFGIAKLTRQWNESLYTHGMEHIARAFTPPVKFRDGMFRVRVDNRSGQIRCSPTGNLVVDFVAPTTAQFLACGGLPSAAKLRWGRNDKHVRTMLQVGRDMARAYVHKHSVRTYGLV